MITKLEPSRLAAAVCTVTTLALMAVTFGASSAEAQTRVRQGAEALEDKSAKFTSKSVNGGNGYVIADGISVLPTIIVEGGHDSNPNELVDGPGSI